jgi:hypothetical protein
MSEYINLEVEYDDDPQLARLLTNLSLAPDGPEVYASRAEGEVGSPLAQALFENDGLLALTLSDGTLHVRRDQAVQWHTLIDGLTATLKEFFL